MKEKDFMQRAILLSMKNVDKGGGPFGAVIVKEGKIIAEGVNQVTAHKDPTAHAEVNAIRKACSVLNTYDLTGCEIFTSCEPCPMCLGAIYWAHLDTIYYANTKEDAAAIQFDDSFIYRELELPIKRRKIKTRQILREEALVAFEAWKKKADKIRY
jgi:guanine deaminase